MAGSRRPAVFVDRDGTVIEDRHFLGDPAGVRLLPGAAAAIAELNAAGWPVILVSNQSGIGRGYLTEDQYRAVHRRLEELLAGAGASLTAAYHCPHAPDLDPPCDCRKPRPGLFQRAAREHGIDLARSFYVGDRMRDLEPGLRLGASAFLVTGHPAEEAAASAAHLGRRDVASAFRVASLAEAVERLLRGGAGAPAGESRRHPPPV